MRLLHDLQVSLSLTTRHEKATVKISTKVTPNFMVLTEQVLGTNICAKIIMARCDM